MLAIPLIAAPLALIAGAFVAARVMPRVPGGSALARLTAITLVGFAAVAFAMNVFLAVRGVTEEDDVGGYAADTVANYIAAGLWETGVLLAAAVGLHLYDRGHSTQR